MSKYRLISINGELSPKDKKTLIEGMLSYHTSQGHPRKTDQFSVCLKDRNKTVGIVTVSFLWNGMEINSLWVVEPLRGQGWGRKLMEAVEQEAVKRNCLYSYTNTFSWQAPEFYEKLGYTLYGKLEDFPEGCSLSYYSKRLK